MFIQRNSLNFFLQFLMVTTFITTLFLGFILSQPAILSSGAAQPPPIVDSLAGAPPPMSSPDAARAKMVHYLEQPVGSNTNSSDTTTLPSAVPSSTTAEVLHDLLAVDERSASPAALSSIDLIVLPLAKASKTLAWKLNNLTLSKTKTFASENYVLSPYSLTIAFGMALLGAKGSTYNELLNGLALKPAFSDAKPSRIKLIDAFKTVQNSIERESFGTPENTSDVAAPQHRATQLNTASKLYVQQDLPINPEYIADLRRGFDTQLAQVDFKTQPDKVRNEINTFVENATNDKIKNLLPSDALDSLTRLVLISAIYMKAEWQNKFKLDSTNSSGEFYVAHKKLLRNDVPMMTLKKELEYGENDAAQFVWMPYRGGEATMVIVVPRARDDGLAALQQAADGGDLNKLLASLTRKSATVQLMMPRFKIETTCDLKQVMQKLHVQEAFDADRANFSGIVDEKQSAQKLSIDKALQKVYIKADESGTEAAAATAVIMAMRSALLFTNEKHIVEVNADRPFMFWVEHNPTGIVLFSGAVVDPN